MVFPVVLAVGALALYFLTKPKSKEIKKEISSNVLDQSNVTNPQSSGGKTVFEDSPEKQAELIKKHNERLQLKKKYYSRTMIKEFWKDLPKSERRKLIKRTNSEMKEELVEKYTKMTWKKISDDRINEGSNNLAGFVNFKREKYNK